MITEASPTLKMFEINWVVLRLGRIVAGFRDRTDAEKYLDARR